MTATLHTLLLACQDGEEGGVGRILESGEVGVNAADESGITAAQVAAANDQVGILRLLVEYHANINQTNNVGWSPLHQACWHGHTDTVRFLLDQAVDTNKRNKYGASALTLAASSGHLSVVRLLLEAGLKADDGGVEDRTGGYATPSPAETRTCPTPLISAALHGREGVLRVLLNRSAKPDVLAAPARWTPLMFAAVGGSKPCCQILLERSADPNKENLLGATALDIATGSGNTDVRVYLETRTLQNKRLRVHKEISLIQAVRDGAVERVEELLAREDTNVDIQDGEGATPLILAAIGGHLKITQLLIGLGANLNHQDKVTGWTALMQATFFSHIDIVELLLRCEADVTLTGQNGCTALDLATLVDDKESGLVRLLAAYTIEKVPPSLVLTPNRRPAEPRLAFQQTRSFSENELNVFAPAGMKTFWSKLAKSFKRSPSVSSAALPTDVQQAGFQEFVAQTSVFTLGFTSSSNNANSSLPFTSPPNFRHFLHDTSCSPGKFQMPPGRLQTEDGYPKTIRLVSITENQYPANSTSNANTASNPEHTRKKAPKRKKSRKSSSGEDRTVISVLKKLGLEELYPLFVKEEVDMQALGGVDDEDLAGIGVHNPLHRDKIINYIKSINAH